MRAAQHFQVGGKDGFTLVEVVVSMVLLSIIFASAFATYFLGLRMINDAREEVRASQIIQSEIERLRTKNWTQLQAYSSGETFEPQGEYIKEYTTDYNAYRYVIPITSNNQMLIAVRVQWTTSNGRQTVRWFNTIFTKDGLFTILAHPESLPSRQRVSVAMSAGINVPA